MSETSMSMGDVFEIERYLTPEGFLYISSKDEILNEEKLKGIDNKEKNMPRERMQ